MLPVLQTHEPFWLFFQIRLKESHVNYENQTYLSIVLQRFHEVNNLKKKMFSLYKYFHVVLKSSF